MKMLAPAVVLSLFAAAASAQHLGFQVGTTVGSSGQPCDPFSCVPANVTGVAGTTILLRTKGATWQPHFLLVSSQPLPCATIPGFGNALLIDGPAAVAVLDLAWAMIYVTGFGPTCGGRIGSAFLDLPAGLPSGASARMQLFAPVQTVGGDVWTFSNAVDLAIL